MISRASSKERSIRRLLGMLALSALVIGACGSNSEEGDTAGATGGSSQGEGELSDDQTLEVGTTFHLTDVDPTKSVSASDPTYLWTLYDSLLSFDPVDLSPEPWLVSEWEWEGDTELLLTLREDVTFHDGEQLDADAVKANLDRAISEESTVSGELGMIDSVESVGEYEVRLHLTSPNAAVLTVLSQRGGMMVSPAAISEAEGGGRFEAVGTGPFQLLRYAPEDRLELERNDSYWRDNEPYLDKLTIIGIPSSGSLVSAYNGGDVDAVVNLPATELPAVQENSAKTVEANTTQLYRKVYMNLESEPLNDVRVRQALNYAIDRESMMEAALPDPELGEIAWMPLPQAHFAHSEDFAGVYDYDPERAKELLADAGYEDGFDLDVLVESVPANQQRAEMLEQFWADIGVRLNMRVMETIAAAELFMGGEGAMFNSQWGGRPDPDMTFRIGFYTGGIFVPGDWDGADELNAAIDAAAVGPTVEERSEAYEEVNRLIVENALEIPLFFEPSVWAWDNSVAGLDFQASNTAKFNAVKRVES